MRYNTGHKTFVNLTKKTKEHEITVIELYLNVTINQFPHLNDTTIISKTN